MLRILELPIDLIARACQLKVLKGLTKAGYIKADKLAASANDLVKVVDPEGLKDVYGATCDQVSWWPLK